MKTISTTLMALMIAAAPVLAAGGGSEEEGLGLMAMLFIGFGVLIVMFQFVPAVMLLVGIIKGVLAPSEKKEHNVTHS